MGGDARVGLEPGGERGRVADLAAVVGDHAAVGAAGDVAQLDLGAEPGEGRAQAEGEAAPAAPAALSASTGLLESAMTTKRSAAAATIFSRRWAPPPPLISQPSGVTWSVPSIAMSSRSSSLNSSTGMPSSRACSSVATEVATQRMPLRPRRGERRQQVGDGRAGAEADRHPVLDQLRRRLGGEPLLVVGRHAAHSTGRAGLCPYV